MSSPRTRLSPKLWWQRRIVKQTVPVVKAELDRFHRETELKQHLPKEAAVFHRTEIVTGLLLGRGGSSSVYEIKCFLPREDVSSHLSEEQRIARQNMADSAIINGKSQYAIKFLQSNLLAKAKSFHQAARDLAIEAKFASSLEHPGVNNLKGVSIGGIKALADGKHDSFFLITERLTETLEDRIERWNAQPDSDASLEEKVMIAEQLAEVLRFLHENRIIFRDLKPSNIGFSAKDDSLKLFDFGFSRMLPKRHMANQVFVMSGVGTRRYMAPEVIRQVPYSCKADLYSWSMIFWQMLHLQKPYADLSSDDHEVGVGRSGHRPIISSTFPESIHRVLQQSWIGCPRERWAADRVCIELMMIRKDLCEGSKSKHYVFDWTSLPTNGSPVVARLIASPKSSSQSTQTYDLSNSIESFDDLSVPRNI